MGKTLGQVAEGQLVKLNESGKPVEFYVAKQNYESGLNGAGRTLLVRKNVYKNGIWSATPLNTYWSSTIGGFLNSTYKSVLDPWVQSAILNTKIYYTPGNRNDTVKSDSISVFALSLTELGLTPTTDANVEGSALPIASTLQIAYLNGETSTQWTRSPRTKVTNEAFYVIQNGLPQSLNISTSGGYRPAFTLPNTLYVQSDGTVSQDAGPAPSSITIPSIAMQNQPITVSWSSVSGADSYILQRKADSGEWEQVYAGSDLTFTDTAGSWATVQYQVCGVFDGTNGAFAQSNVITVVPASALVISGQDGDLGTINNDIPYSVNSDTGNDITLVRTVNGAQVATATVQNGFSYNIPVLDLPTGTNTIVITATVTASSGQVTATRTWTYTKAAASFPTSGGVAALSQDGQPIFPQTLAEAVKTIGGPWGGNLSTALDKLARAATYSSQILAKYTEVDVNLATAKVGDIVNLPVNGVMVPHIVVQVGNPDPSMYDSSCDGVWILRQDIVENGQWNSTNVNTLSGSTIMATMQGYVTDYDSTVQAAIQTVKIPYCVGGGNTTVNTLGNGLECKMFPLGGYEVGWTTSTNQYFPVDGAVLSYFQGTASTDPKRIAYRNGLRDGWWLRSQNTSSTNRSWYVLSNGENTDNTMNISIGLRPCFLLPTTFTATYYVDTAGNVYPSQEYTTAGDFYDLWGNVIPSVKIATGSYTGTGTYGADNPNTLTLPFEPKVLIVSAMMDAQTGHTAWIYGDSSGAVNSSYAVILSWDNNTVSWYSPNSASYQLNGNALSYQYVAIG